jgi:uncharacterized protein YcgI (DUF1989 family)
MISSATRIVDFVPARYGKAIPVAVGQTLTIVSKEGAQVLDLWALRRDDPMEYMSMEHTRSKNSKVMLGVGDSYVSIRRRPMFTIVEDTSPGIHDTLLCACNSAIYEESGCTEYHRNCSDNFHEALADIGVKFPFTPGPLNVFMNIPIQEDHSIRRLPPATKPGDYLKLRADMDLIAVISACPQDISVINGIEKTPRDVHYIVES